MAEIDSLRYNYIRVSRFHLNHRLAEMLLVPDVLVSSLRILKSKDLLVHHRFDLVRIDRFIHILKLHTGSHQNASDYTSMHQCLQHTWLLPLSLAEETNNVNDPLHPDCIQRLLYCTWAANFDNVVTAIESSQQVFLGKLHVWLGQVEELPFSSRSQLLCFLTPVRSVLVVDDVMCAELLQLLCLLCR